jgi:hypothetical protein
MTAPAQLCVAPIACSRGDFEPSCARLEDAAMLWPAVPVSIPARKVMPLLGRA